MSKGFLDEIKKAFGDSNYAGDENGGAAGQTGQGLPTGTPGNFMFATGIECSYPTINNGKTRRDLLQECGHYDNLKKGFGIGKRDGAEVFALRPSLLQSAPRTKQIRLEFCGRSHGRNPKTGHHTYSRPVAFWRA